MKYQLLPDVQESPLATGAKALAHGVGQTAARIGETIVGAPGDILSAGLGVANWATKDKHFPIPSYEQLQESLPVSLPTSSQVRAFTKEKTGGALEPQSEPAKFANSIIETATSLAAPGGLIGKGMKVGTALKGAAAGETFGYLAKALGGSNLTSGVAKALGTLGGTTAFRGKELKELSKKNYEELASALPGNSIPSKGLAKSIEELRTKYTVGDSPAKGFAQDRLAAINDAISGSKIDAGKLWNLKKNANEHFATANKAERKVLHDIISAEKEALKSIPNYEKLEMADDIHRAFIDSDKATKFIRSHAPSSLKYAPWLKGLFFAGSTATGKLPLVGAAYGGFKIANEARMVSKFLNTSSGKKYYGDVLKAGFDGNARAVTQNMAKLNNAALEFEKGEKQPKYVLLD